jgi:type IV pilus assembly protein PilB
MSWFRRRRAAPDVEEQPAQTDSAPADAPLAPAVSAPPDVSTAAPVSAPPDVPTAAPVSAPAVEQPAPAAPPVSASAPPELSGQGPAASELSALESALSDGPSALTPEEVVFGSAVVVAEAPPAATTAVALLDPPKESNGATATAVLDPPKEGNGANGKPPKGGGTIAPGPAPAHEEPPVYGPDSPSRPLRPGRRIGEVVVDLGFADRDAVEQAVAAARAQRKPTGQVLVERGVLRQDQLARVVAERFGLEYIDLSSHEPDMGAVNLLSSEAIKRYQAVPVRFMDDGALLLAMADPTNILSIDDIAMITNRRVRVAAASAEDIAMLAGRLGRLEGSIEDIVEADEEGGEAVSTSLSEEADQDAPVIKLVHSIIAQAVQQGASDIHINPEEGDTRVLFRVDGVLYPAATVRRRMATGMVSRIKIMADLDISERRIPQDGRLALNVDSRRIDIRVVTLPLVYGEGAVMRILDKGAVVQDLGALGLQPEDHERFARAIARPHGAVLVTGPTGSGKSTTLYAALAVLNNGARSILTIEDPVESRIAGIKQMQIAPKAGVTFDTGLRSFLRADPDVIMVGEIRDKETAHIAVEAALTGHMVLSTLHTRDAPAALGRLIDMGIEPFLISSAVDCVVAQRLVRKLCPHCKRHASIPESTLEELGLAGARPYEAVGCSRCAGSGYRGRVGIYEVMTVSEEIRTLILKHGSVDEIAASAVNDGMPRLRDDGLEKIRAGLTSVEEVERIASSVV